MKNLITLLGIILFSQFTCAQKINDDFTGKWKAPKGALIDVTKSVDGFIGKTEIENAIVLKDVKFSNNRWTGTVINPKEKIIAKCELILYPTKLKIIAKKGIFHKTIYWIKQ